jgi:ubiquinone/menaquinone biosynthesis C-methylase UbiE
MSNRDHAVVEGFGQEWSAFDQSGAAGADLQRAFEAYFGIFPWTGLPPAARGFDLGCGSGRWARLVAPRVGELHCIDASAEALAVARRNLERSGNVRFHHASVDQMPLAENSMDFGYSLGVLHHVPDTAAGVAACVRLLKPGAPFLLYLYYAFDNRPVWFRALWRVSDAWRRLICRLPFALKRAVCEAIAAFVYWPLARLAKLGARLGRRVDHWPLSAYRDQGFYIMRNDSLDRFGTRLEQRFTRREIEAMMRGAGLDNIRFNEHAAFWCAVGFKR